MDSFEWIETESDITLFCTLCKKDLPIGSFKLTKSGKLCKRCRDCNAKMLKLKYKTMICEHR